LLERFEIRVNTQQLAMMPSRQAILLQIALLEASRDRLTRMMQELVKCIGVSTKMTL
jgi:hypothetical protein